MPKFEDMAKAFREKVQEDQKTLPKQLHDLRESIFAIAMAKGIREVAVDFTKKETHNDHIDRVFAYTENDSAKDWATIVTDIFHIEHWWLEEKRQWIERKGAKMTFIEVIKHYVTLILENDVPGWHKGRDLYGTVTINIARNILAVEVSRRVTTTEIAYIDVSSFIPTTQEAVA